MKTYQNIVVGVDFSDPSQAALRHAIELAVRQQSRLSILHIIDDNLSQYWDVLPLSPIEMEEQLLQKTKVFLDEKLQQYELNGIEYEAHVIFGKPFQALQDYCEQEHADLLIVGQRGATLLEKVLMGSTAERLIRTSRIPLLTVHANSPSRFRRIIAATDFSELSIQAINKAVEFAMLEQAELHIVHVSDDTLDVLGPDQQQRERAEANLEKFLQHESLKFQGMGYRTHIAYGVPHNELVQYTHHLQADLIVMGYAARSGILGILLGNTAEAVSSKLSCSLLTIQSS